MHLINSDKLLHIYTFTYMNVNSHDLQFVG